jgi:hypothetical protein
MIPEASFLFAIAGISGSLAGLAGLVAGIRRGADMRPMDLYRLREIVEFAFSNIILALSFIPIAAVMGTTDAAVRVGGLVVLVWSISHIVILEFRRRRHVMSSSRGWYLVALSIDMSILALVLATVVSGSFAVYEVLLLLLLIRPMAAFLLVVAAFDVTQPGLDPRSGIDRPVVSTTRRPQGPEPAE